MNKIILISLLLFFLSCSDDSKIPASEILLSVTGDQVATIFIYNSTDILIGRYVYDYSEIKNESKFLIIHLHYSGSIFVSAVSLTLGTVNNYYEIQSGKTKEIFISF